MLELKNESLLKLRQSSRNLFISQPLRRFIRMFLQSSAVYMMTKITLTDAVYSGEKDFVLSIAMLHLLDNSPCKSVKLCALYTCILFRNCLILQMAH